MESGYCSSISNSNTIAKRGIRNSKIGNEWARLNMISLRIVGLSLRHRKEVFDLPILEIEGLIESLSMLHNLFDIIRVIDPVEKKVIRCGLQVNGSSNFVCYDFWKKEKPCENCVSGRAMAEKDSFIKIGCKGNEIFMVMASLVKFEDKSYIVEMVKNITHHEIINGLDTKEIKDSYELITKLNKKIVTDGLTNTYNRKYINERLPVEIFKAQKSHKRFSVIMLDVDLFKEVNDTYGHLAGDMILQKLSRIMEVNIREGADWVARYGGDEFLIFLQDVDQKIAYKIADKIRKDIEDKIVQYDNHMISVTVSIGIYTVSPDTKEFNDVIKAADNNLYRAKNKGRNRIVSS